MAPEASAVSTHPMFPGDVPKRYVDDILQLAKLRTRARDSGSDYLGGPNCWKIAEGCRMRLKGLIGDYLEVTDFPSEDTALVPLDCGCEPDDVFLVSDAVDRRLEEVIMDIDELRSELRLLHDIDRYGTDADTKPVQQMFHVADRPAAHQLMNEMLTLHRATAVEKEIMSAAREDMSLKEELASKSRVYRYVFNRRVYHLAKLVAEHLRIDGDDAEEAVRRAEITAYHRSYPASGPGMLRRWRLKGAAVLRSVILEPQPPPHPQESGLDKWMREGVTSVKDAGARLMLSLIEPR